MSSARLKKHPIMITLTIGMVIICIVSLLFMVKQLQWGLMAAYGGMAAWLPNTLFIIFISCYKIRPAGLQTDRQTENPAKQKNSPRRIAWVLAAGEVVKMLLSFTLLLVALISFQMAVLPLIAGWVSVLTGQIITPMITNNRL